MRTNEFSSLRIHGADHVARGARDFRCAGCKDGAAGTIPFLLPSRQTDLRVSLRWLIMDLDARYRGDGASGTNKVELFCAVINTGFAPSVRCTEGRAALEFSAFDMPESAKKSVFAGLILAVGTRDFDWAVVVSSTEIPPGTMLSA